MPTKVRPIPEGYHSITPQLTCRDAARAIDFYKQVFGAKTLTRMDGPGGKVMHAELQIGDSRLMLNDEFQGVAAAPDPSAPHSTSLFLYTEDVDTLFNRALQAGCKVKMPLENQFWGDRYGKFTDPFGHQWAVATHVEEVAPEEMKRRSAEAVAKMSKAAGQSQPVCAAFRGVGWSPAGTASSEKTTVRSRPTRATSTRTDRPPADDRWSATDCPASTLCGQQYPVTVS
jgi:PhnB protein